MLRKIIYRTPPIISITGLACMVLITIIGYSKIGYVPRNPEDFSFSGYVATSQGHFIKHLVLTFIEKIFTLIIFLGIFFNPILVLIGVGMGIINKNIQLKYLFYYAIPIILFYLIIFQHQLGLNDLYYCFFCWYLE